MILLGGPNILKLAILKIGVTCQLQDLFLLLKSVIISMYKVLIQMEISVLQYINLQQKQHLEFYKVYV